MVSTSFIYVIIIKPKLAQFQTSHNCPTLSLASLHGIYKGNPLVHPHFSFSKVELLLYTPGTGLFV